MSPNHGPCSVSIIGARPTGGFFSRPDVNTIQYFPYIDLQSGLQESSSPQYAEVSPFMRAGRVITYTGRSQRTLSALIRLLPTNTPSPLNTRTEYLNQLSQDLRDTFSGNTILQSENFSSGPLATSVIVPAYWLAALKDSYIDENTQIVHAPPAVSVQIGGLISMRAVVTACSITWRGPWYHAGTSSGGEFLDGTGAMPGQADVAITFSEISVS